MIVCNYFIVALVIVVSVIVLELGATLNLLRCRRPNEVDLGVVQNLFLLVVGQLVREVEEGLLGRERELDVLGLSALRRGVRVERKGCAHDLHSRVGAVAISPLVRNSLPVGGVGRVRQQLAGQVRTFCDVQFVINWWPGAYFDFSTELVAAGGGWPRGR